MPASLFRENSSQRFRRESLEMWEKVKLDTDKSKTRKVSARERIDEVNADQDEKTMKEVSDEVIDKEETPKDAGKENKKEVKPAGDSSKDPSLIFPRKVKSKFVATKPALWEQNLVNTKNRNMKKK